MSRPHGLLVRHVVVDARIARATPDPASALRAGAGAPRLPCTYSGRAADLRPNDALFRAEIEDLRAGALLRLAQHERLALHDLRDLARRIVQIAEDAALGRADADACRQQLVLDAVRAEVALLRGVRVRIDEQLIVGAGLHARAAADARVAVQIDDAVAALEQRVGRADLHAGRFVALVAQHGEEEAARVGERAFLDRLHPAAVDADRDLDAPPCTRSCRRGSRCTCARSMAKP